MSQFKDRNQQPDIDAGASPYQERTELTAEAVAKAVRLRLAARAMGHDISSHEASPVAEEVAELTARLTTVLQLLPAAPPHQRQALAHLFRRGLDLLEES